jgi:hypothetical protein
VLQLVALVKTDVSQEHIASIIMVTRIEGDTLQETHGLTSQKTTFLMVTAVKTSNLT